jgi:hypothetical protein
MDIPLFFLIPSTCFLHPPELIFTAWSGKKRLEEAAYLESSWGRHDGARCKLFRLTQQGFVLTK